MTKCKIHEGAHLSNVETLQFLSVELEVNGQQS